MRNWRGSVRFVLASALAVVAPSAQAQLLVATPPGDPPAVSHAELAYASGEGVPVTWLSLRLARGPVVVVAALPDDAVVEPALDAWFAALEVTASPNVLMPDRESHCKSSARFAHVTWPRDTGAAETALELHSAEDVQAALDEQGVSLSNELPVAARYLLWSWTDAAQEQTTRTLRVLGGATPLTLAPGATFPVLVSAVTRGPVSLASELKADELGVTFRPGEPAQSDYRERLRGWIAGRTEPLLEMRARAPLFDWSIYDDAISLAPLVQSYARRAAKELKGLDADVCTEQLRALREPGAPSASACGEARDAELAVRAVGSEQVTLQRFALSGGAGLLPEGAQGGGDPREPVLHARHLDEQDCEREPDPVVILDPPLQSGSNGSGSNGTTTVVVEETVPIDETPPPEIGCGSSTQSEGYGSSERDDSGCSSDTSSTSSTSSSEDDTSPDSCSGDSSSSSDDTSSDSCSGDSSSSSDSDSSGSGCSSDSSSGYDGDTCTASAAPGSERTQKSQAGLGSAARPKRLKTSLWTLAFAAVIFPIRRRKRAL